VSQLFAVCVQRKLSLNDYPVSLGAVGAMIVLFMEITKSRDKATKPKTPLTPTIPTPPLPGQYEELKRPEPETADETNYVT
jgi:hypothetical protein